MKGLSRCLLRFFIYSVMAVVVSACAATGPSGPMADPQQPYPLLQPPRSGDILHLPTGYLVDQRVVEDHARRVQIIYVGETHDSPADHRIQEQLLQTLHTGNPGNVTLAMEMFAPSQQPVLDRWSAGELSERDFLRQVDWQSTWGFDFALYRNLLDFCRDNGIRILAINTERELRHTLARTRIDDLPEDVRRRLPDMDFSDPYHEEMARAFYSGHGHGQGAIDGFRQVQTLWDETMAHHLAEYLSQHEDNHQVMVVAGGNHIRYGFGIPRRTFRRFAASYLLIGTAETDESRQIDPERFMNVTTPDYPLLPFHFLYYTTYEKLPRMGVRLGVSIASHGGGGVMIERIMPGSAALEQGLKQGDLLLTLEGQMLQEAFDLTYALGQKQVGETVRFELLRGGEKLLVEVKFSAENQRPHGTR